jgi:hypothetical protein
MRRQRCMHAQMNLPPLQRVASIALESAIGYARRAHGLD